MVGLFIRAGVVPSLHILTTQGRKSGQLRANPVTKVQRADTRWLAAPYGPAPWVMNARASGRVNLRRGRERADYTIREVTAEEAGPVLKQYLGITKPPRPYFQASLGLPHRGVHRRSRQAPGIRTHTHFVATRRCAT